MNRTRMAARVCVFVSFLSAALLVQGRGISRHFIVLDPEHPHASAVFAQSIPGVSKTIHVYAPPGHAATAFLERLATFNHRATRPTTWQVESHISPDFLQSMLREPPGNIVVITSRNDLKIQYILSCLRAGQHVLADKPWIINPQDFASLEESLRIAQEKHVVVYDGMTERFNVAYQIQRELMRDPSIFGQPLPGSALHPAVELKNLHSLVKFNDGKVITRPPWFLDIRKQGEAIADVGTHLVDLEMWSLFPDQAINRQRDVEVLSATRSPITLTLPQFERLTNTGGWPTSLEASVHGNRLRYFCNNTALYKIRGIFTSISDRWEYESPGALSDSYLVLYWGTRATIRVEQSKLENYVPEIDIFPNDEGQISSSTIALKRKLASLSGRYPQLSFHQNGRAMRVVIPDDLRVHGSSTFEQLVKKFLEYVENPQALPDWEQPNLLAKYFITTSAVRLADKTF